jgi:circadian clock protein KaiC
MTDRVTIHRLPTGVPGFDEVLGGGIPEFSFNFIAGPPGSGKTTLAHQMMFAMATAERPALYFTALGEPPLKVLRYQQQFSFFDSTKINGAIRFANLGDATQTGDLEQVLQRIETAVEATKPSFVFVDSFRSVVLASETQGSIDGHIQHFVQQLGMLMTSWKATTFLIGENFSEIDGNPVFTIADGLIWMRQSYERNSMVRKLQISKMRGQATLPGLHSFRMSAAGLEVFPPADVPTNQKRRVAPSKRARVSMGNPILDDMLGGGLPAGYSLLVAGPSGSGKSILAAAFLAEGARLGEGSIIASFEQQPNRIRTRPLAELIANGKVSVIDSRAPDLSIDEVVRLLVREIDRTGATRVVIDSLSGFELSLAPTFREDFRESMARLVSSLAATGVTVLMTSELEDRYTDLRFSPYGTAFLTDAIIVQRYIELDSRLRRVMAVVKVRSSAHSDELRAFTIDDDGIQIGDVLSHEEGLLGGRPTRSTVAAAMPREIRVARA